MVKHLQKLLAILSLGLDCWVNGGVLDTTMHKRVIYIDKSARSLIKCLIGHVFIWSQVCLGEWMESIELLEST